MKFLTPLDLENLPTDPLALEYPQQLMLLIKLSDNDLGTAFDDQFVESIEKLLIATIGEQDDHFWSGHEFGGGYAKVFFNSNNVDQLYQQVHKPIKSFDFRKGSKVVLDYAEEENIPMVIDLKALCN